MQVYVGKSAYTCRVPIDAFAAQSTSLEPAPAPAVAQVDPESELKAALQSLMGSCVRVQLGYWTYEVCIGKSVNQFHVEGSSVSVVYSLGNYARSMFKKSSDTSSSAVPIMEIFSGGTNCDETGSGRNSIVGYVCGSGELTLSDVQEHEVCVCLILQFVHAANIVLFEVCGYKMVVSSRVFCSRPGSPGPAATSQVSSVSPATTISSVTMRSIVNELGSSCYTLADGWWTYQLCPGIIMKQYHATPAGSVDPASEFSLGSFNASASDQEPAAARHRLPVVYREEYSQGTQCDIGSKQHRSTIVSYECDIDSAPTLVQVCKFSTALAPQILLSITLPPCRYGSSRRAFTLPSFVPHLFANTLLSNPLLPLLYRLIVGLADCLVNYEH